MDPSVPVPVPVPVLEETMLTDKMKNLCLNCSEKSSEQKDVCCAKHEGKMVPYDVISKIFHTQMIEMLIKGDGIVFGGAVRDLLISDRLPKDIDVKILDKDMDQMRAAIKKEFYCFKNQKDESNDDSDDDSDDESEDAVESADGAHYGAWLNSNASLVAGMAPPVPSFTVKTLCFWSRSEMTIPEKERVVVKIDVVIYKEDVLPIPTNMDFLCNAIEFDGDVLKLSVGQDSDLPCFKEMGKMALPRALHEARNKILTVTGDKESMESSGIYVNKLAKLMKRTHEKVSRGFQMSAQEHCFTTCHYRDVAILCHEGKEELVEGAEQCPICLDSFKESDIVTMSRCGHVSHASCSVDVVESNRTKCSVCRMDDCYMTDWVSGKAQEKESDDGEVDW